MFSVVGVILCENVVLHLESMPKQHLKQYNAWSRRRKKCRSQWQSAWRRVQKKRYSASAQLVTSAVRSRNVNVVAVSSDKYTTFGQIKIQEVRSFKSSEHIRKEVGGPYFEVSAKKASSVTL